MDFPYHLEGLIHPSLSEEDNERLCAIPTPEDIKAILFMMQDLKAHGPDGFPVAFYKTYWPIVGVNLTQAVISFFRCGSMPKDINSSLIVLIPKVIAPLTFNNYRPISLCNVVYKVISKILVSRIKPFLPKLISPTQFVFIPDRWIIENQVIVHELIHSFKTRKIKTWQMAINLDLQKAYDKVNWDFLKSVLSKFGFYDMFVSWILACVSSVSSKCW